MLKTIEAGAIVAATATVEEATKDVYNKLKGTIVGIFGRQAGRAADKIGDAATRDEGRAELAAAINPIPNEDTAEIQESVQALLAALKADPNAQAAVQRAQIDLDLDVVGNVLLKNIQNAQDIGVKAKVGGDFTLSGLTMGNRDEPGN
ncbi:hypothetical protein [Microvirga sp. Mcv34]|uniref:hypothetical protein n=1 Tax=Microvirga sp. Mcv34 TaxID=2926016 RepID=UPI0021C5B4D5|nr:hypothetical protein [Microvirga sp. Mcv34]